MKRILVVEDDETLAMGIKYALEQEGWKVSLAYNLETARKNSIGGGIDLILLDVMLPDGNGFSLCREVRKVSDLPIIFLTARDEEVNIVLGLESGADDYITKPFRLKELISRIRANLRRATGSKGISFSKIIRSGGLVLDIVEKKVFLDDVELSLTPTEHKLLLTFMQNPYTVLNRDKLLEKVWELDGEFIDDNTLSVHIRRLREKIESDPSNPSYIITVRGFGYKWSAESK